MKLLASEDEESAFISLMSAPPMKEEDLPGAVGPPARMTQRREAFLWRPAHVSVS